MVDSAENKAAVDDDLGIYGSDDEPFTQKAKGGDEEVGDLTLESTALGMDTSCASDADRQNLKSAGSMGTVMSSDYGFDCLNLDTIGEELALRAVDFSLSGIGGPDGDSDRDRGAPEPQAESVAMRSDEPRTVTPAEQPAPESMSQAPQRLNSREKANMQLRKANKDGSLQMALDKVKRKDVDCLAGLVARNAFVHASQAVPALERAALASPEPAVPVVAQGVASPREEVLRVPPASSLEHDPLGCTGQLLDIAAINASIKDAEASRGLQRPATATHESDRDGVAEFSVPPSEMSAREAETRQARLEDVAEAHEGESSASCTMDEEATMALRVPPAESLGETTGGPGGKTSKVLDEVLGRPDDSEDPFALAAVSDERPPQEPAKDDDEPELPPAPTSGQMEEQRPVFVHSSTEQLLADAVQGIAVAEEAPAPVAAEASPGQDVEAAVAKAAIADEVYAPGLIRKASSKVSATSLGREDQLWASNVLGKLAQDNPFTSKRKLKPGCKRPSTGSIIRALGCLPSLQGSMSSPSIAANSVAGQQSTNSIRSPLTSPSSSQCFFHQSTWTPPSPPAPSSTRTDQSQRQRAPSLPAIPAAGLRVSPCSSANTQRATSAQLWRSAVPGLDLTRVRMGFDDDEDTEDDPTGGAGTQLLGNPASGTRNPDVPQLDMSSLQFDASQATRSSGTRTLSSQLAPRDIFNTGSNPTEVASSVDASLQEQDVKEQRATSSGDLRPVVPGPRELAAFPMAVVQPPPSAGGSRREGMQPAYMPGYPNSQFISFALDATGCEIAGTGTGKKTALDVPARVRLPPVSKTGLGGSRSAIVSHVHMHHHHHYHVTKPAHEADLQGSASTTGPGVPGAGGVAAGV